MFQKLRNRFLLMNMVIISLIMLAAFGTIYTVTYRNVRYSIYVNLHRMADSSVGKEGSVERPPRNGDFPGSPRQRSVAFELRTDERWNITQTDTRYDLGSGFYAAAVKIAAAHPRDFGQFTIDGTRWAYSVSKAQTGYSVYFMDVTAQQEILSNLIYTFSAVALVMLGVIYLASRYFADRSIAPVREAFDKQKQFIADASHELKTPLAVIHTNADVLLASGEDTIREQAKWLHRIKSETERMKSLTNDLLYLTEMDDARTRVIHTPFDLSEAIDVVILTMEAVIFEKDLTLEYDIEPGLKMTGSREQIKQVAMILLDNAVKYTNPKGAIGVALKRVHGDIELSIANTGPGIPAEHLGKIFDRFYRVDPSRSRQSGGHGLGLAIAKSIVEQHRGKIYARSAPNENTTFYVQLG
jgi:signal transduction histidine kinase